VRPETRERVEAAMLELDFVPNLSARGLRNGRSGTIAVALPDLATAYSADLMHRVVEAAHERGLAVQIEETASAPYRENELLSRARAHLVDGLILNPIRLEDSVIERVDTLPPIVIIGEVEQSRTDHVGIDSRLAAADVTRHVLAQGARRVAVVGGDDDVARETASSRLRLEGVRDALKDAGIEPDPRLAVNALPWTMSGGAQAVHELIARRIAFDAIVCFTDSLAAGALHALHANGVRVPEDVIVTGFDDVESSRFTVPALTTLGFDRRAFADAALVLLESRMDDRSTPPRSLTLSHHLVVRESTAVRPAGYRPS
jgi:DNA-binding LacI/PurR family transcriptional regulator